MWIDLMNLNSVKTETLKPETLKTETLKTETRTTREISASESQNFWCSIHCSSHVWEGGSSGFREEVPKMWLDLPNLL